MSYFAVFKPYIKKEQNEWEIFNEVCVMMITYILMFLSNFDASGQQRYMVGWMYIAVSSFNLACNAYKIAYQVFLVTIPQIYREWKQNREADIKHAQFKEWIQEKIDFCKANRSVILTQEMLQICENYQFLLEKKKKNEELKIQLDAEQAWLTKKNINYNNLYSEWKDLASQIIHKELELIRLNNIFKAKFNQIDNEIINEIIFDLGPDYKMQDVLLALNRVQAFEKSVKKVKKFPQIEVQDLSSNRGQIQSNRPQQSNMKPQRPQNNRVNINKAQSNKPEEQKKTLDSHMKLEDNFELTEEPQIINPFKKSRCQINIILEDEFNQVDAFEDVPFDIPLQKSKCMLPFQIDRELNI